MLMIIKAAIFRSDFLKKVEITILVVLCHEKDEDEVVARLF